MFFSHQKVNETVQVHLIIGKTLVEQSVSNS